MRRRRLAALLLSLLSIVSSFRPMAQLAQPTGTLWCDHSDCLESVEDFPSPEALESHQAAHGARRVVIVPGNGGGDVTRSNWYGWLAQTLREKSCFEEVILRNMPDPVHARESVWLPFLREECACGPDTIVVGHSSGAEAAMRLAEHTKVAGLVLVSSCHTDLGDAHEAASGYYARPWLWDDIRSNAGFISIFHSNNDPFIPLSEAQHVADSLQVELDILPGRSHFFDYPFPELLAVLEAHSGASRPPTPT